MKRPLPDPDLNLRDAADFILNSELGRKALKCRSIPLLPLFLQDLTSTIYRLTMSCQLPEFTDHGLMHLCSLIDRISLWTYVKTDVPNKIISLLDLIEDDEAAILLLATLIHDIGMLSQKPEDLDEPDSAMKSKGQMDVATWVRKTHIDRMEKLVRRLFIKDYRSLLETKQMNSTFRVAKAHGTWPWKTGFNDLPQREQGLAAVLAIVDLLDEDANRCDTTTLMQHRQGNVLNIAHWIRHALTVDRVLVAEGNIKVTLARPPGTNGLISLVFSALRNHYRLIKLYNDALKFIGCQEITIDFDPGDGLPARETQEIKGWEEIQALASQDALIFHLMNSFFDLALLDKNRVLDEDIKKVSGLGMECIALENYNEIKGTQEINSPIEQEFYAILQ